MRILLLAVVSAIACFLAADWAGVPRAPLAAATGSLVIGAVWCFVVLTPLTRAVGDAQRRGSAARIHRRPIPMMALGAVVGTAWMGVLGFLFEGDFRGNIAFYLVFGAWFGAWAGIATWDMKVGAGLRRQLRRASPRPKQ